MTEFVVPTVLIGADGDNDSEYEIPVALQEYHVRERVEGDQ